MPLVKIFCEIDDFCKDFLKQFKTNLLTNGNNVRRRAFRMGPSEVMTIVLWYPYSGYKTFKDYYEKHVLLHMQKDFRNLVSYNRFLELRKNLTMPLLIFAQLRTKEAPCSGISYIDSYPLKVSHTRRESSHKTFRKIAAKGKTSVGWFYGFKLHIVINHLGQILSFCITPGNVSDNNAQVLTKLTKRISGKLYGDKGYIVNPKMFEKLYAKGVHLVTKVRSNMKNKFISVADKFYLKKRGVVESVGAVLKENLSLEHSRHRSFWGFICHVVAVVAAYDFRVKKPRISVPDTPGFKIA